jgi:RNA methyltransferase, TrmH family
MALTSAQNPALKRLRLAAAAGRTTDDGLVVAEGPHLLREATRGRWQIVQVFCTESAWHKHEALLKNSKAEVVAVGARALQSTAATEASQEILMTLRPPQWKWADLWGDDALVVGLDGLQDPGNAGTAIRSAEAFGASGVVFLEGSVRVTNGKLLRAAAGSLFRMPYREPVSAEEFIREARRAGAAVMSLDMRRSMRVSEANLRRRCALVVGSEGAGVRSELLEQSEAISIPTRQVESLNAGVACSLALYEAFRQRSER